MGVEVEGTGWRWGMVGRMWLRVVVVVVGYLVLEAAGAWGWGKRVAGSLVLQRREAGDVAA